MENIYRGYPLNASERSETQNTKKREAQASEAPGQQAAELRPYMIYNREMQNQAAVPRDERKCRKTEYEYFRGLYPLAVRNWQRFVEEEIEKSDRSGSMIYDEYPDRESLYVMRERILNNAGDQGVIEKQDMVMILLLHEILRRRNAGT